jgi:hypothetical protein
VEGSQRQLGDVLAQMNMDAYGQGLNMANAASARAPQTYNLGLAPQETLGLVGGQYQQDQQNSIDEAMQRFNFEQLAPLLYLQSLQSLTGTAGQYGGTTNTSGTAGGSDGGAGAMQAIGGMIMLAAMMYSDRRLKKDVQKLSSRADGLNFYEFRYIWEEASEPLSVGFMADEVEKIYPNAVIDIHGYKMVDYARIPNRKTV